MLKQLPISILFLLASATSWAGGLPENLTLSVCRPEFTSSMGTFSAGTAFVIDKRINNSKTLLITAHHLFGPNGGLDEQLTWEQLPQEISAASCQFLANPKQILQVEKPLPIRGAKAFNEEGDVRDIAAFPINSPIEHALNLSDSIPQVGETVWLVAQVFSGAAPDVLLHKARVVESNQSILSYKYENSAISLRATSGAPIVDSKGRVVGINYGVVKNKQGLIGSAVGLGAIIDGLSSIQ